MTSDVPLHTLLRLINRIQAAAADWLVGTMRCGSDSRVSSLGLAAGGEV